MTLGCKWFITRSDLYQLLKWSWCFCKWLIIFFNGKSWSFESEKLIAADSLDSLTLKNTLQYNLIRSNFPCISHAFVLVGCWLFFFIFIFFSMKSKKSPRYLLKIPHICVSFRFQLRLEWPGTEDKFFCQTLFLLSDSLSNTRLGFRLFPLFQKHCWTFN